MQSTTSFSIGSGVWPTLALILSALSIAWGDATEADLGQFQRSQLRVESADARHDFDVYLALTPRQQARGLMYVKELPAREGMLFVYERKRIISMWMKNTHIALDMLFIDDRGHVSSIIANTTPFSEQSILSQVPVTAVLELNAGTAKKLGIRPGDRVIHELLE